MTDIEELKRSIKNATMQFEPNSFTDSCKSVDDAFRIFRDAMVKAGLNPWDMGKVIAGDPTVRKI